MYLPDLPSVSYLTPRYLYAWMCRNLGNVCMWLVTIMTLFPFANKIHTRYVHNGMTYMALWMDLLLLLLLLLLSV